MKSEQPPPTDKHQFLRDEAYVDERLGRDASWPQIIEAANYSINAALTKAHQDGWYEGRNHEIKLRTEPTDDKQEWKAGATWITSPDGTRFECSAGSLLLHKINAALAKAENAEVQRLRDLAMEIQELKRQLAAEREKNERQVNTFRLLEDALGIVNPDEHTDQLFIGIANLKGQLLQAQVAIAELKRIFGLAPKDWFIEDQRRASHAIANLTESVDLSALERHDAEVRKPLVDVMERIRNEAVTLVDAQKYPNSVLHVEAPQRIKSIANAAIADAKTDRA